MILKALIKKQMREIFKGYFYDNKKKQTRTKANVIFLIALYAFLMVVVVGGSLAAAAVGIGTAMIPYGFSWMYYLIFACIAILLGAFGSVFSTYQGLYLSKDNDLLLSMPIPVGTILVARLIGVYLMGLMYSGVVTLPAAVVCLIIGGFSINALIGGILFILVNSLIVFILSCLLGFAVAKLSKKMKNKSFAVVALSVAGLALYYVVYFKAQVWIRELCENAVEIGTSVLETAPFVAFLGGLGAGNPLSMLTITLVTVAVLFLTLFMMSKTFLSIATASATTAKAKVKSGKAEQKTVRSALISKEFRRYATSPNYMLNCSLGLLMIPAAAIALLIGAGSIKELLAELSLDGVSFLLPFVPSAFLLFASMNDIAAPSVSLEGKGYWQLRALPIDMKDVIFAKMAPQFVLTLPVMLLLAVCVSISFDFGLLGGVLIVLCAAMLTVLATLFNMAIGIRFANLSWTNEIVPIKQGAAVALGIFGLWGVGLVFAGIGLLGALLPPEVTIALQIVICAGVCYALYRSLMTKGIERLNDLI